VAVLARWAPVPTRLELPGDPDDGESRYLEAAINGVLVASIYSPNGNSQPGPKFDYQLAWLKRLAAHAADLYMSGAPVVLAGDYNVVPTDLYIYLTKSSDRDALLQPESRAAYQRLLAQGWTDAVRASSERAHVHVLGLHTKPLGARRRVASRPHSAEFRFDSAPARRRRRSPRPRTGGRQRSRARVGETSGCPNRRTAPARHVGGRTAIAEGKSTRRLSDEGGRETRVGRAAKPGLSGRALLVIDGDSFAHRSYHALPKTIRRSDSKGAGAIFGFANFLLRFYADQQPRAVIVGWDSLEAPTKRREMFPAYQSGREFDDDLIEQLNVLPEFVAACGFANVKAPGFEADDFLAAAVASEERAGGSALVASGDRDSFQLASPETTILYPVRGGEIARIGPDEVRQRYGVDPKQVPDFIALRGDPSDKLPGAAGVGPKRAAELVRRYGSLNGVLDAGLFQSQAQMLRLYRLIATMDATAPLPSLADQTPNWVSASNLARRWGLKQLADRLAEKA
jgi:5'-3' exonuclease